MKASVKSLLGATVAAVMLAVPAIAQAAPTASPTTSPTTTSPTTTTAASPATPAPTVTPPTVSPSPSANPSPTVVGTPRAASTDAIALVYAGLRDQLGAPVGDETPGANNTVTQRYANGAIIFNVATGRAFAVYGSIWAKYSAMGAQGGTLGRPLSNEEAGGADARQSRFENGVIVWSPRFGAFAVLGAHATKYAAVGGAAGIGVPTSDQFPAGRSSTVQRFDGSLMMTSTATGTRVVRGAILGTYAAMNWENGILGLPISDEEAGGVAGSRISRFQNGAIIWSPGTGAHAVYGAIYESYRATGGEAGPLGLPTSGEFTAGRGARAVNFQRGVILWTAGTGANPVYGAIFSTYRAHGFERGVLGLPRTPEFTGARGARVQNYENGQIIWSPATGANAVYGSIASAYASLGWEGGVMGLPTTSEFAGRNGARVNRFQNGVIIWTGRTGAFSVRGAILDEYGRHGWEGGRLGAPIGDENVVDGGWTQDFENGRISFIGGRFSIQMRGPAVDDRCRTGRVLCISKADRKMRWMIDGQVIREFDARFGSTSTPTREGSFTVFRKVRDDWSYLYNSPMPFSMYFSGGQAVHYSADFAARGYAGASHGCVNIRDYAGIQWLYDTQVRVGDRVVVYW